MKKVTVEMTAAQASVLVAALAIGLRVFDKRQAKALARVGLRLADAIEAAFPKESK